jgi:hypothetical protein
MKNEKNEARKVLRHDDTQLSSETIQKQKTIEPAPFKFTPDLVPFDFGFDISFSSEVRHSTYLDRQTRSAAIWMGIGERKK